MKNLIQCTFFTLTLTLAALGQVSRDQEPTRLIFIKSDGLPPDLMAAVALPERSDLVERLPYAKQLRLALKEYRQRTGRKIVLPNIRRFFYEDGVVFDEMHSYTLTLSAASWGVIETGQPSVIKGHGTFSRDTCHLRSHLDGLRDTWDQLMIRAPYNEFRTAATWRLEQVGVPLISDLFDPMRSWTGPHIYRRSANRELLLESGKRWLSADGEDVGGVVRGHLSRLVTGLDYTEFNQQMGAEMAAQKVLEKDLHGRERFDFISPLFTLMDHQQHVDPHPLNLIHWLVEMDRGIGLILRAVAQSERRDRTVVALASDHGSEIKPGQVGYSFPITKVFREKLYGGHTMKTLLVEAAWSAVSVPIPGMDRPRIYESDFSPYNQRGGGEHGEDGYVTAYIDPFGNGRAAVFLRNNDLNRLHLLLLELKKSPQAQRFERIRRLFRSTLERARRWLEPDLALYEDYVAGAADLAANLEPTASRSAFDMARRLEAEVRRDRPQIAALKRLLSIAFDKRGDEGLYFDEVFSGDFEIPDFIPKEYLGRANNVHQLTRYTIGLDEDLNWIETTEDHRGRPVPMDYFRIMREYQAANAPVNSDRNPYDLIVAALAPEEIRPALLAKGLVKPWEGVENVAWLMTSADDRPGQGGEALVIEADGGRMKYVPVQGLAQDEDGDFSFTLIEHCDPLGLLAADSGFAGGGVEWMRTFRPRPEWLKATHNSEYGTAPSVILDIVNDEVDDLADHPEFIKHLIHFSSPDLKRRYLRGLKRKYASARPDFIVWAEELWNFNSKARTSGGNHSGLRPMVSKTAFALWGGDETGIHRGRTVKEICTTLDIVPTLLAAVGRIDAARFPRPAPGADPRLTFRRYPGNVVKVWE